MMRALIWVLAALLLAAQPEAHAQQTWSADEVAQHCTMEGAFGQTFGERRANGRTGVVNRQFGEHDRTVRPPTAYPPFTAFEIKLTPLTRLITQVTARARFESDAEAEDAYQQIVAAYDRGNRFPFQNEDMILLQEAPAGITFKTEDYEAALSATVARAGRTVYLVCAHGPLSAQGFREAFDQFDRNRRD